MADKIFIPGMILKDPRNAAPEFILGHLSIKVDELIPFLQKHASEGWVNIDLCRGRSGKPYASLDNWKPTQGGQGQQSQRRASAPPPPPPYESDPMDNVTF